MAGAGYKLFQTGDVLTAAQVNTYLNEQTVMVFANAAARTSALTSVLAEGMVSYLQDTNVVEVYNGSAWVGLAADQTPLTTKGDLFTFTTVDARLGVGANGTVLTADSAEATGLKWAAPASGGGMTLLSTTALTSAATFTVSSISGSYTDLKVVASGISLASTDQVLLRFNGITSGSYFYAELQVEDGTAYPATNTGQTNIQVSHMISTSDYDKTGSFEFIIPRYAAAEQHTFFMSAKGRFSTANKFFTKICRVDTALAIDSITIFTSSSSNFSAGNLYIYGVK
jgi:hypothetical protein